MNTNVRDSLTPFRIANAEAFLAVCVWGASFSLMKISVNSVAPFVAVWFRVFFGLPVFLFMIFARKKFRLPTLAEALPLLGVAMLGVVIHQNVQFWAMRSAGAANSNWMVAATPCIVAVLGWLFLGEWLSLLSIGGLVLSAAGVLFVVGFGTVGLGLFAGFGSLGDLLMAISVLNWSVFQILSRKVLDRMDSTFAITWMNIFALIVQTPFVFATDGFDAGALAAMPASSWGALIFLGVVCNGLAYMCWYDAMAALPIARVAVFQFIQPLSGAVAAYFLVGERFTPYLFIGGAMIFAGVWMVNKGKVGNKEALP